MKRLIIIAAVVFGFAAVAAAQPRAIGLRGGYGLEASYQHTVEDNFVKADLGLNGHGLNVVATYNWNIIQPNWTDKGNWNVYAGPGGAIALYNEGITVCAAGMGGLEYTFWFPLQLSVDMRLHLGVGATGDGLGVKVTGYWPALSARYRF